MELVPVHRIPDQGSWKILLTLFRSASEGKESFSSNGKLTDEQIIDALRASDSFWFAATDGPQDDIVGLGGLQHYNPIDRTGEIGVAVLESSEHRGFGLSITRLVRKWGIDNLNLRKTTQYILEDSPGLHLTRGMEDVLEGTLKRHRYKNGRYFDVLIYSWERQE